MGADCTSPESILQNAQTSSRSAVRRLVAIGSTPDCSLELDERYVVSGHYW